MFIVKTAINVIAAAILAFGIYKTRYGNKQLAVSMLMLNIFVFSIMGVITQDNFGLQAGLGLFAILSIFRFRSENFEQMDIAYFFGSVALATVNGISSISVILFAVNILILGAAIIVDINGTLGRLQSAQIILDSIPAYLFNEEDARRELSIKFQIEVRNMSVEEVDYVKETVKVRLYFIADSKMPELIEAAIPEGLKA